MLFVLTLINSSLRHLNIIKVHFEFSTDKDKYISAKIRLTQSFELAPGLGTYSRMGAYLRGWLYHSFNFASNSRVQNIGSLIHITNYKNYFFARIIMNLHQNWELLTLTCLLSCCYNRFQSISYFRGVKGGCLIEGLALIRGGGRLIEALRYMYSRVCVAKW